MNIAQIEENIQKLLNPINKEEFIFDFMLAYGLPKASITRLKKGNLNLSKQKGEIAWKKKVIFKVSEEEELYSIIDSVINNSNKMSHEPRFVIVTNFKQLVAKDTKTHDSLDIAIEELNKHFDFFLPWAGMEKANYQVENPADVKAAEKMAKLYDEIKRDNEISTLEQIHDLNVFLSRLLFCFFAEDTGIFTKGQFTQAIESHTQEDGSDLNIYLIRLFEVLNSADNERGEFPAYLMNFPYVNGKLFENLDISIKFSRKSRQAILDCGSLDWSLINPDIFGSMIQAVVTPEYRGHLGMHYTSLPNIMKVIKPLFLDGLYEEYEYSKGNVEALSHLHERLTNIKIFDPACGSGNFLIISYKELRKLEMKIFDELNNIDPTLYLSAIELKQFYGIEVDDFAHEIAMLSLWLSEHQMNLEFFDKFGRTNPTLPLKESGKILNANATRVDWEEFCPHEIDEEVYILGNPPYLGSRVQEKEHKEDINFVFEKYSKAKSLDYISCWFYKAAEYTSGSKAEFAFVSTNSITQGEQVAILWPLIFSKGVQIKFAHTSFKWTNNAKGNAGVVCVVIGIGGSNRNFNKRIYRDNHFKNVTNINPYLVEGETVFVERRNTPISNLPTIYIGNMPNDFGWLILDENEKVNLINDYPKAQKLIKKFVGAEEFIKGSYRWCLWIEDKDYELAVSIQPILERIQNVRIARLASKNISTVKLAEKPYQFRNLMTCTDSAIIIPSVSSERREYIPIGFTEADTIISNLAFGIYDSPFWVFGVVTSKMHMIWIKAVGGRMKTDYRYSAGICYNTFPFPIIKDNQKKKIELAALNIIEVRERYSEFNLAHLYDPKKMPPDLKKAHIHLDEVVEKCYRVKAFNNDEERLEELFNLYKTMS